MKLISKLTVLAFLGCTTLVHAEIGISKYNRIIKESKQIKSIEEEIANEQKNKSVKESRIKKLEKRIERCKAKIGDAVKAESGKIENRLKFNEKRREQYVKSGKNTERVDADIAVCKKEIAVLQALAAGKTLKEAEAEAAKAQKSEEAKKPEKDVKEDEKAKDGKAPSKDDKKGVKDKKVEEVKEEKDNGAGEEM